jgi:hypothetical protein
MLTDPKIDSMEYAGADPGEQSGLSERSKKARVASQLRLPLRERRRDVLDHTGTLVRRDT